MTQIIPVAPVLDPLNDSGLSRVEAQVDEHRPPWEEAHSIRPSSGEGFQDKSGTGAAMLHQGKQVSTTPRPPRDYEMPLRFQRERKPFFCLFLFHSSNFTSLAKACTSLLLAGGVPTQQAGTHASPTPTCPARWWPGDPRASRQPGSPMPVRDDQPSGDEIQGTECEPTPGNLTSFLPLKSNNKSLCLSFVGLLFMSFSW